MHHAFQNILIKSNPTRETYNTRKFEKNKHNFMWKKVRQGLRGKCTIFLHVSQPRLQFIWVSKKAHL